MNNRKNIPKIIAFILVAIMLFTLVGCSDSGEQGTLTVGEKAISRHTTVYDEYATVSLCDVISALGFELAWESEDKASFYCDDVKYELCVSQKKLIREGKDDNYLICSPDNENFVCDVIDGVLIVDDITLKALFCTFMNYPINVFVDSENNSVIISR